MEGLNCMHQIPGAWANFEEDAAAVTRYYGQHSDICYGTITMFRSKAPDLYHGMIITKDEQYIPLDLIYKLSEYSA